MSPTGQISPAIRFDRVFLFALVLFSKDPFEPMCLFGCEPFIPERKIVTYHAGVQEVGSLATTQFPRARRRTFESPGQRWRLARSSRPRWRR
jgi:hypothetical protein